MDKNLGVWRYEDCALVLIDYQNEMFETIRSETSADLADRDWAQPPADRAREVIYWYFTEGSKLNANVGVNAVEKRAAGAREHA